MAEILAGGLAASEAGPTPSGDEDAWRRRLQMDTIIARMGLDPAADFERLSAGLKRRILLARGLVRDPDIVLLDEPTNHLDIDAIAWLEDYLLRYGGTLVFVTHDRVFLRKLATRIIEIDRGRLIDWVCDFDTFTARKQAILAVETTQAAEFDKKLAQEEVWIRQGIEARRTRNEGRVRALEQLAPPAPRPARAARRTAHADPGGGALGAAGDAGGGRQLQLWRSAGRARLLDDADARRQGGHRRPQRLREDHAAAPPVGRAAAAGGHAPPRRQPGDRLLRPVARPTGGRSDRDG